MTGGTSSATRVLHLSPLLLPRAVGDLHARGVTVITPNREAARSLHVPAITIYDAARRVLVDGGIHVAPKLAARRALVRAAAMAAGDWDPDGLATAAEATLRELMRSAVDFVQLKQDSSPRVRRLADVALAYRCELAEAATDRQRYVDEADVLWRAAELIEGRGAQRARIVVVGYPRLPVSERRFIDAHAAPGSTVYLPAAEKPLFDETRDAERDFEARGWQVQRSEVQPRGVGERLARAWVDPGARASTVPAANASSTPTAVVSGDAAASARAYPDLDAEVRGTLAEIKRLLIEERIAADRIAVIARHEQAYGPAFLAVAEEYGVPFRVLYDTPLAQTRLGAWVAASFEVAAEGFPFEATARWLAGPVADARGAATWPETWPEARRRHPAGEAAWRELGATIPAAAWPSAATRRAYVERLEQLLEAFDVARRCARWPREAIAFRAFADGLLTIPELDGEVSIEAFAAEIGELLALLAVPVSPGRGGVELHTPLSMFGAEVDCMFVVGMAEGWLPNPVGVDPLLDPLERARLLQAHPGIEDVRAAARREEISFWASLQSARQHLVLSYPKLSSRSEILPSPYLERLGVTPSTEGRSILCSARESRRADLAAGKPRSDDPLLAQARHAHAVELERESERPHGAHDGAIGVAFAVPARGIGVTRLIDMATCPFKFWAKSVLRLAAPEEAPTEFDHALRGTVYHETLHRAVQKARGSTDLRDAALMHVEAAFAEAEQALEASHGVQLSTLPAWERDRAEHITVLRNAIRADDFARPDAEVVALEEDFRGNWRGIPVRGRIDRVDVGPDGATLIDYKSGSSVSSKAKDGDGRATVDLQLQVYREGAAELVRTLVPGAPPRVHDTYYFSITKGKRISVSDPPDAELSRIADEVADAWRGGIFHVDPDVDQRACRYCDFDDLCRKGPRLDRKRRRA